MNPHVGVGVIIQKDDDVLLLRRKNVLGDGTWSTPGGYLEFGERVEDCAIREAKEETGLTISDIVFLGITSDIFEEENKHFITIWMRANRFEGKPVVNADYEMSDVKWFKWSELPENLFKPFKKVILGEIYKTV